MKRFLTLFLALCLCVGTLIACDNKDSDDGKETQATTGAGMQLGTQAAATTAPATAETTVAQTTIGTTGPAVTPEGPDLQSKAALYKSVAKNIYTALSTLGDSHQSQLQQARTNRVIALADSTNDLYKDASGMEYMTMKGVVAFVYMLSEMMDNPNFRITKAPVSFTCSYDYPGTSNRHEDVQATLLYQFDEQNDKVVMTWSVVSTVNQVSTNIFLYIGTDYDFDTDQLKDFEVHTIQSRQDREMIASFIYDEVAEKMLSLDTTKDLTAFRATVAALETALTERADDVIDLNADFSTEYSAMMDEMNKPSTTPQQPAQTTGTAETKEPQKPEKEQGTQEIPVVTGEIPSESTQKIPTQNENDKY